MSLKLIYENEKYYTWYLSMVMLTVIKTEAASAKWHAHSEYALIDLK